MHDLKVSIIGGGLGGLTTAYRLSKNGFDVRLFESSKSLGGLARTLKIHGVAVEAYYHHFFPSDNYLIGLCTELGIKEKVQFHHTRMGFFSNGRIYDFGTPFSLIMFKPLPLRDKLRFGLSMIQLRKENSEKKFENYTVEEWLIQNTSKKIFEVIWRPLLVQKFGEVYKKISMAWLWRKLQIKDISKKGLFSGEKLAYLKGSFQILIEKLFSEIIALGGKIDVSNRVTKIIPKNDNDYKVVTNDTTYTCNVVISTVAPSILSDLVQFPDGFNDTLLNYRQLGIICALLVTRKPLTHYYWLNIAEKDIPFGLVVEHTNFCRSDVYNGRRIIYVSKYVDEYDSLYSQQSNQEFLDFLIKNLKRINPNFGWKWIEEMHISRDPFAQPIIEKNYSLKKPTYRTPLKNFYWISANHIYPDDRGINYTIKSAEEALENFTKDNSFSK